MRLTLFLVACRKFFPILVDVAWLTMLSMFGEANAVEMVLKEDEHVKLKYLITIMTTSRTFGKSSYAT